MRVARKERKKNKTDGDSSVTLTAGLKLGEVLQCGVMRGEGRYKAEEGDV